MKSQELADQVAAVVEECQKRIVGIGAEQYAQGDTQKFETMKLDDLFEYVEEEIRDLVNYAVMVNIRIQRLREAANQIETLTKEEQDKKNIQLGKLVLSLMGKRSVGIDPIEDGIL